ncbi:MAG: GcrA family cell cycle regulator [Lachnospiraceae bacterium]|nr:GcrA family cell cycle regulator [Lachnospiraceae bacterium]
MGDVEIRNLILGEAMKNSYPRPKNIAKKLGVSKEVVMKVLITAGLWESEQSRQVKKYAEKGMSCKEIAEALNVTEKAVWPYMVYKRSS